MIVRLEFRVPGVDEPVARCETLFCQNGKSYKFYTEWHDIHTGEKKSSTSVRPYVIGDARSEAKAGEDARNIVRHLTRVATEFHSMRGSVL